MSRFPTIPINPMMGPDRELGMTTHKATENRSGPQRVHKRWIPIAGGIVLGLLVLWFVWGSRGDSQRSSPYQPALAAAPGYQMVNVTEPGGVVDGLRKNVQVLIEKRPCTYTLLGWSDAGLLYYHATCGNSIGLWSVDPSDSPQAQRASFVPASLHASQLARSDALDRLRAPGVRPARSEPPTRDVYLRDYNQSPDGEWLAVVARHLYGPEDVLLVSRE